MLVIHIFSTGREEKFAPFIEKIRRIGKDSLKDSTDGLLIKNNFAVFLVFSASPNLINPFIWRNRFYRSIRRGLSDPQYLLNDS